MFYYKLTGTVSAFYLPHVSKEKMQELEDKMVYMRSTWSCKNKNGNLTFTPVRFVNAYPSMYAKELESLLKVLKGYVKVNRSSVEYEHEDLCYEGGHLEVNEDGQVGYLDMADLDSPY